MGLKIHQENRKRWSVLKESLHDMIRWNVEVQNNFGQKAHESLLGMKVQWDIYNRRESHGYEKRSKELKL